MAKSKLFNIDRESKIAGYRNDKVREVYHKPECEFLKRNIYARKNSDYWIKWNS